MHDTLTAAAVIAATDEVVVDVLCVLCAREPKRPRGVLAEEGVDVVVHDEEDVRGVQAQDGFRLGAENAGEDYCTIVRRRHPKNIVPLLNRASSIVSKIASELLGDRPPLASLIAAELYEQGRGCDP